MNRDNHRAHLLDDATAVHMLGKLENVTLHRRSKHATLSSVTILE